MASPIRRNPKGPLRFAELVKYEEALWWDKTRPPAVEEHEDDHEYVVHYLDRPDSLAHEELGDDAAGHLIMLRNDMRLWPNDFVPGLRIQIPTRLSLSERGLL